MLRGGFARSIVIAAVVVALIAHAMAEPAVTTGLDRVARKDTGLLRRLTRGNPTLVLAHAASVLPDLTHAVDALFALSQERRAPIDLVGVLAPEHGFRGAQQAGAGGASNATDPRTGLPVLSVYTLGPAQVRDLVVRACSRSPNATRANDRGRAGKSSGSCTVLVDLQDCGARFYTYIWTMYDMLVAAAAAASSFDVRVVVLDRPNPLGGADWTVRGPVLEAPAFASGVGRQPLALQHGMTMGELASLFNAEYVPKEPIAQGRRAPLEVVSMAGWRRAGAWPATLLPWVPPSPNLPSFEVARAYVGLGLVEGTNVSEGRGTTLPFVTLGAPFVDYRLALALRGEGGEGGDGRGLGSLGMITPQVGVREAVFVPTFSKYANRTCVGVEMGLLPSASSQKRERGLGGDDVDFVMASLVVLTQLQRLYPKAFAMTPFFDLLVGTDAVRKGIEAGQSAGEIAAGWQQDLAWFKVMRSRYLLYK